MLLGLISALKNSLRRVALIMGLASGLLANEPFISPASQAEFMPRLNGLRNGIPQQVVYCLERDSLGRVWAGTRTGPYVYNGRRWKPVPLPASAPSRQVRTILEDHLGQFWFGTQEGGIWCLRQGEWSFYDVTAGLPANRINSLVEWVRPDGSFQVWAATTDGVAIWDGQKWGPQSRSLGLPHLWVWRFRVFQEGGVKRLWAATQKGLAQWDGARWGRPIPQPPVLEVNDLVRDDDSGAIWASLWGRGPARWDGKAWTFPQGKTPFPGTRPTFMACGRSHQGRFILWVGTYDRGLATYENGEWQELSVEQGLNTSGVFSLLHDQGGGRPFLWIGTRGGGISTLGLAGVARVISAAKVPPMRDVRAVAEGPDGSGKRVLWFGTRTGVVYWDGKAWKTLHRGLPSPEIFSLAVDAHGTLWVGTVAGAAYLRPGETTFHPTPGFSGRIHAITPNGQELWAGTEKGLYRWMDRVWAPVVGGPGTVPIFAVAFTYPPGLPPSLWAATAGHGVWESKNKQWTQHHPNPNFPKSEMSCFLVSPGPKGELWLWVGIQGNGLARMDTRHPEKGWVPFSTRNNKVALPENIVRSIARDTKGSIYIGQSLGICRFKLDDTGMNLAEVESLWNPDGLPSRPTHFCSGFTDSEGKVWFGFPEEAGLLDPESGLLPPNPPAPIFEATEVQGRPFNFQPGIALRHQQNKIMFEFFIPSFLLEEDIQFQTQLAGFEEPTAWGMENRREFTDLRAGSYVFKVWAQDGKGRVGPPLLLPFSVRPAPWRHPLALTLYFIAGILSIAAWVRFRTGVLRERAERLQVAVASATAEIQEANAQLHRLNEEKNQFLGIAAHDLKNPLSGILLTLDLLEGEEDLKEVESARQGIRKATIQMVELIKRLLDVSAIESGNRRFELVSVELLPVAYAAKEAFRAQAASKGLHLRVEAQDPAATVMADLATLHEIVENLVSNAVKFTTASPSSKEVLLRVRSEAGEGILEIADQGPGFTPEDLSHIWGAFVRLSAKPTGGEHSTGLGLSIVKQFVEGMGGHVELDTEIGKGSTFRLRFPAK